MRTLIIGDVHGCFDELQDLLALAGLGDSDAILGTGDIVDRGPGTPEVLRFFAAHPNACSVAGNHERKHVRSFANEIRPAKSQLIARAQLGADYPDWVAYMSTFPLYLDLPEALLVHAFFEPGIALAEQKIAVLCGHLSGEFYLQKEYARPWYELYDLDKPIIVGHHDILHNGQVFVYQERVFGLDTSCVHGGRLSGLLLPDFKILSVPSRENYWQRISEEYRLSIRATRNLQRPALADSVQQDLETIVEFAHAQNAQLMAILNQNPDYDSLPTRQQAKQYADLVGNSPIAVLLHLARKGQLDLPRARDVLRSPEQIAAMVRRLGISERGAVDQ